MGNFSPQFSKNEFSGSFSSTAETDDFDLGFDVSSPPVCPNQYLLTPSVSIETAVSSRTSMEALDGV